MLHTLNVRIKNMARWESNVIKVLGVIEICLGISLLVPALVALIYGEDPTFFIYPAPFLLIPGILQYIFFKSGDRMKPAGGMMMIFVAWWLAFFVTSIPYYLYGLSFVDSLFEGISGFTTTGISLIGDASAPHSILFWGSFMQWAGGIAIIMIFVFLIPMMGIGGRAFVNNELAGSDSYNFSMRIKSATGNFLTIYVLLSAVEVVLLMVSGVDIFAAVTMMLSTISTGGFMAVGSSMSDFSFAAQVIVLAFMFLGGTNFYLHYRALNKREFSAYRRSQEFIWTAIWFLAAAVVIIVILLITAGDVWSIDVGNTVWETIFTVVSVGTTTGYTIAEQSAWPLATYMVFWLVMIFGSMSGSTSGGIKIYRLLIIKSYVSNGIYKMFHPRSVRDVRMDGHSVSSDAVVSAVVVIVMFLAVIIFSTVFLLISEPGISIMESMGLSISAVSNSGVNMGTIEYTELSSISKMFIGFIMWVGRLEVVIALLLFTRTFWSDLILDIKGNRRRMRERKV